MSGTPQPGVGDNRPFLTRHALERCCEMAVDRQEVVDVLREYESRYPSPRRYGPGRLVSAGGRLAVVHTESNVVITVLWNGLEGRAIAA